MELRILRKWPIICSRDFGEGMGGLVGNSGGRYMTNQWALNNLGGCLSALIGSQFMTKHVTWKERETGISIVQDAL